MVHEIKCSEIWGGIHGDELDCQTNSLRASLFSRACDGGKGGDLYYFSVCGSDLLTRLAIADVVGHGEKVSKTSQWLYDSLESNMNNGDGSQILVDLNRSAVEYGFEAMATAVVAAFYREDQNLYFSYAGHHAILIKKPDETNWRPVYGAVGEGLSGLPLGIDDDTCYEQNNVRLESGDRIFLYTDGIVEAMNRQDDQFGEERLLDVLKSTDGQPLPVIRTRVLESLLNHTGNDLSHDDVTFLAIEIAV